MPHILYLVHDLHDPAVRRRVMMLVAGQARVTLAGFRRGDRASETVAGLSPIDLGTTSDGKFAQRIAAVAGTAVTLGRTLAGVPRPDIIIGRNLEMLALAKRARGLFGGTVPIVYECLDIHRLMLREGAVGRGLRGAERLLAKDAALLVTSSPAFLREYFEPRGQIAAPVMLLENKVLDLDASGVGTGAAAARPAFEAPIRIGWFGALRCRRSLALLSAFTRAMEGRFEVVLRGRPAYSEFDDFDRLVAAEPFISFEGPYRNPDDLAAIYGDVHFTWAIDFFEEGLNSSWLLPNRLYEGCRHGAVPIAVAGTETARFLADHRLGLVLAEPTVEALSDLLAGIDGDAYAAECARVGSLGRERWVADAADCCALVDRLRALLATGGIADLQEVAA